MGKFPKPIMAALFVGLIMGGVLIYYEREAMKVSNNTWVARGEILSSEVVDTNYNGMTSIRSDSLNVNIVGMPPIPIGVIIYLSSNGKRVRWNDHRSYRVVR